MLIGTLFKTNVAFAEAELQKAFEGVFLMVEVKTKMLAPWMLVVVWEPLWYNCGESSFLMDKSTISMAKVGT